MMGTEVIITLVMGAALAAIGYFLYKKRQARQNTSGSGGSGGKDNGGNDNLK